MPFAWLALSSLLAQTAAPTPSLLMSAEDLVADLGSEYSADPLFERRFAYVHGWRTLDQAFKKEFLSEVFQAEWKDSKLVPLTSASEERRKRLVAEAEASRKIRAEVAALKGIVQRRAAGESSDALRKALEEAKKEGNADRVMRLELEWERFELVENPVLRGLIEALSDAVVTTLVQEGLAFAVSDGRWHEFTWSPRDGKIEAKGLGDGPWVQIFQIGPVPSDSAQSLFSPWNPTTFLSNEISQNLIKVSESQSFFQAVFGGSLYPELLVEEAFTKVFVRRDTPLALQGLEETRKPGVFRVPNSEEYLWRRPRVTSKTIAPKSLDAAASWYEGLNAWQRSAATRELWTSPLVRIYLTEPLASAWNSLTRAQKDTLMSYQPLAWSSLSDLQRIQFVRAFTRASGQLEGEIDAMAKGASPSEPLYLVLANSKSMVVREVREGVESFTPLADAVKNENPEIWEKVEQTLYLGVSEDRSVNLTCRFIAPIVRKD